VRSYFRSGIHTHFINFIFESLNMTIRYNCFIILLIKIYHCCITGYCWGRGVAQRVPCNCDHFLIYCTPHLSSNHSRFIRQSSLLWLQQTYLVAKRGGTGRGMAAEFFLTLSLAYLKGTLTCRKILRHGAEGFTSPPKEVMLRTLTALKIIVLGRVWTHEPWVLWQAR
jgi:hypothetical protein